MQRVAVLSLCLSLPVIAFAQVIGRVSEFADGSEFQRFVSTPVLSPDARRVTFRSITFQGTDPSIWHKNLQTGALDRVAALPAVDTPWSLTSDGRHLAFASGDERLVPDKRNRCWVFLSAGRGGSIPTLAPCSDVFVRDLTTGSITRLFGPEGVEIAASSTAPSFSADDRWILYTRTLADRSQQPQIRQLLLHNRLTRLTAVIADLCGTSSWSMSDDASRIAVANTCGSTSGPAGVLLYDRTSGAVEVQHQGEVFNANVRISGDGRYVAFDRRCPAAECGDPIGITLVYIRDVDRQRTWNLVRGPDRALPRSSVEVHSISRDGRFVVVGTVGALVAEDTNFLSDVYVVDRVTGTTARVSVGPSGEQGNFSSGATDRAISADGSRIVFSSAASNLLPSRPALGITGHVYIASLDRDVDGMHDEWERFVGLSPGDPADASRDPDADGLSNVEEFRAESHPTGYFQFRTRGSITHPEASRIRIRGPGRRPALVWLRLVDARGRESAFPFRVPAGETTLLPITDIPDRPHEPFTLHVESDEPIFPGLAQPK